MIAWLASNISTIIVASILIVVTAVIIASMIKNKKQGKSSCGCGCAGCAMKDACHDGKKA